MLSAAATVTPMGVDIAKAKFDAAAGVEDTYKTKGFPNTPAGVEDTYKTKGFPNTPAGVEAFLLGWRPFAPVPVCREATGRYGEVLATFLVEQAIGVSVVNPAPIHAFGTAELKRTTTDQADAKLIARFCQLQPPPAWQPLPPAVRPLQALVRRLDDLTARRQMEHHRQAGADVTGQAALPRVLALLAADIAQTRAASHDPLDQEPDRRTPRKVLDTIPGLGEATIAVRLACLGDVQRFDPANRVAAFAGLSPAERPSGKYQGQTRLSKIGEAFLRNALYFPAIVAGPYHPLLPAVGERLKAKGKPGKVIVCAALRKWLTLAYGVLKSGCPFDPKWALAN